MMTPEQARLCVGRVFLDIITTKFPMPEEHQNHFLVVMHQRREELQGLFVQLMAEALDKGSSIDDVKKIIEQIQKKVIVSYFDMVPKLKKAASQDSNTSPIPGPITSDDAIHVQIFRILGQCLCQNLKLGRTNLLDELIASNIISDEERSKIMSIPGDSQRNEAFLDITTANLSSRTFQETFLPLLEKDELNSDMAAKMRELLAQPSILSTTQLCTFCFMQTQVVLGKMSERLYVSGVITKEVEQDLTRSALTSDAKWKLLLGKVKEEADMMKALEEAYPHLHMKFAQRGHSALGCCCDALRADPGEADLLRALKVSYPELHTLLVKDACDPSVARDSAPMEEAPRDMDSPTPDESLRYLADRVVDQMLNKGLPKEKGDQLKWILRAMGKRFHTYHVVYTTIVVQTSDSLKTVIEKIRYLQDLITATFRQFIAQSPSENPPPTALDSLRRLRTMLPDLGQQMTLDGSLFDAMVSKQLMDDSECNSIMAQSTNGDKMEAFFEFLVIHFTEKTFMHKVLPLIYQDEINRHLAEKIHEALNTKDDQPLEPKCTHCQLTGLGIMKNLSQSLLQRSLVTEAQKHDLREPAIPNTERWEQIRSYVDEKQLLSILREDFPIQYEAALSRKQPLLDCRCGLDGHDEGATTTSLYTAKSTDRRPLEDKLRKVLKKNFGDHRAVSLNRLGEDRREIGIDGGSFTSSLYPDVELVVTRGCITHLSWVSLTVQHTKPFNDALSGIAASPIATFTSGYSESLQASVRLRIPILVLASRDAASILYLYTFDGTTDGFEHIEMTADEPYLWTSLVKGSSVCLVSMTTKHDPDGIGRHMRAYLSEQERSDQYVITLTSISQPHESVQLDEAMSVQTESERYSRMDIESSAGSL